MAQKREVVHNLRTRLNRRLVGESLSSSQRGRPRDKLRPPSLPYLPLLPSPRASQQATDQPSPLSPQRPPSLGFTLSPPAPLFPKSAIFPLHFSPFSSHNTTSSSLVQLSPSSSSSVAVISPPTNCANKLQRAPSLPSSLLLGGVVCIPPQSWSREEKKRILTEK